MSRLNPTRRLPQNPNLEQLRKQAKELLVARACAKPRRSTSSALAASAQRSGFSMTMRGGSVASTFPTQCIAATASNRRTKSALLGPTETCVLPGSPAWNACSLASSVGSGATQSLILSCTSSVGWRWFGCCPCSDPHSWGASFSTCGRFATARCGGWSPFFSSRPHRTTLDPDQPLFHVVGGVEPRRQVGAVQVQRLLSRRGTEHDRRRVRHARHHPSSIAKAVAKLAGSVGR